MSGPTENHSGDANLYHTLSRTFLYGAILLVIFGLIHLNAYNRDPNDQIRLYDSIFNIVFGILFLIIYAIFKKRSWRALYLLVIAALISTAYGLLLSRGFNFIILAYCIFTMYLFSKLKKAGILT